MDGWTVESVIYVGCLIFAGLCLAWAVTFGFWSLLRENSPEQPDGRLGLLRSDNPPTASQVGHFGSSRSPVRCSPRVVLGDTSSLSTTLASGWRLR